MLRTPGLGVPYPMLVPGAYLTTWVLESCPAIVIVIREQFSCRFARKRLPKIVPLGQLATPSCRYSPGEIKRGVGSKDGYRDRECDNPYIVSTAHSDIQMTLTLPLRCILAPGLH